MAFWTFCSKTRLFDCKTSAASLFNGSSGFGSYDKQKMNKLSQLKDKINVYCDYVPKINTVNHKQQN